MAVVCGRLQIRDWQDKEGNKRRSAEVVTDNIYFGESKRRDDSGSYRDSSPAPRGDSYENTKKSSGFSELDEGDGELPF